MNTKIRSEKALQVLLYLAARLPVRRNMYHILKAVYQADKYHLERFGRQLFPQDIQKLQFGNVPAYAYDILNHVKKGRPQPHMPEGVKDRIKVDASDNVKALVDADLRYLSKSEIECLDKAIADVKDKDFNALKKFMHEDPCFQNDRPVNSYLDMEKEVISKLENAEELLAHLKSA